MLGKLFQNTNHRHEMLAKMPRFATLSRERLNKFEGDSRRDFSWMVIIVHQADAQMPSPSRQAWPNRLPINLAAVPDPKDAYAFRAIVDLVDDPVIADAKAPASARSGELFRSRWSG
jgi:hypothetical protein